MASRRPDGDVSREPWTSVASAFAFLGFLLPLISCGQSPQDSPPSAAFTITSTQLPRPASAGIKEIPLPVDMNLAKHFVKIGFGPLILGETGFQSTQLLTPVLSTRQASELVLLVPEYGHFKGPAVAKGVQG